MGYDALDIVPSMTWISEAKLRPDYLLHYLSARVLHPP